MMISFHNTCSSSKLTDREKRHHTFSIHGFTVQKKLFPKISFGQRDDIHYVPGNVAIVYDKKNDHMVHCRKTICKKKVICAR